MNTYREINREIKRSGIWLVIGLLSLIIGQMLNYQETMMNGVAIGFISIGLGQLLIYTYIKKTKNARMIRNIELEKDERNTYINTKAGYTAFWISYCYIAMVAIFGSTFNISLMQFLMLTIILMPLIHLALVFLYHKKY
jgi:hypothetical protein